MGLTTEKTDLDAILLKQINIDTNVASILTDIGLLSINGKTPFKVSTSITRPADTTAYAVNDILNNNGASVLPTIDFGIANANKIIVIKNYKFTRNYALNLWAYDFLLYNSNAITGQNLADNQAFNPSYAEQVAKTENYITSNTEDAIHFNGTNSSVLTTDRLLNINAKLDASGKLYLAVIVNTVFTPVSASIMDFIFYGDIL